MSSAERANLAAMLDLLVYEGVLLLWQQTPHDTYQVIAHDGELTTLTLEQAEMWAIGAFATFIAFVDQGRVEPRKPPR